MNKIAKTLNIHIRAEIEKSTPDATLDFMRPIILDNKIVITPVDLEGQTNFVDAELSADFVEDDFIVDNVRTVGINLTANVVLIDTENDDFYIDSTRLLTFGELVIGLDANLDADLEGCALFVEPVVINDDIVLVTENIEEEPETETAPKLKVSKAEVLTEDTEESENGPEWVVTYNIETTNESLTEEDGSVSSEETAETAGTNEIINAPDIQTAAKYAEQLARIKAKEDPAWAAAEVISIEKKETENNV